MIYIAAYLFVGMLFGVHLSQTCYKETEDRVIAFVIFGITFAAWPVMVPICRRELRGDQ